MVHTRNPNAAARPFRPHWRNLLAASCLALGGLGTPAAWAEEAPDTDAGAEEDWPLIINGCPIWPYTRCPGADLRHADLVGQNLAGADLRGANLTRADLRAANLSAANLEGADLTAARMNKVNAASTNFRNTRMVGADLEAGRLMRSDFSGADFTGASLEFARLNHAWFIGAKLASCNLQEAKFVSVRLDDAVIDHCVTRFTIFPESSFENCQGCPTGW
ncbi:pentapeptide repeat-containing protein [Thauera linaloolentis]|uniref:Pentapeptide repeat-containing protein n=1 Tax=Thauera linaloolentis (strain DSM 12138 / JCM 21573 / CCUG 41526 / CIP 105981 / IAM 15112 / NBRC 102519 / 47Lol) TaxID=1123367 RepID=N6Y6L5_THAL4|nr:pentapeptide repeat-containing protein [Thauera linaloolentis]ENO87225.1 pentapeptide repeat-containing protein [Thauera linaloolentis 47Lol = DSM 12138]MCM8567378.1 pentapeptide repeat-containing protein [Thauera linaloolentis]